MHHEIRAQGIDRNGNRHEQLAAKNCHFLTDDLERVVS